jgi:hypothetical protein
MPVQPEFLIVSVRLTELLGKHKYAEARELIANTSSLTYAMRTYFMGQITDHEKYLGPYAPRKKPTSQ